MCILVDMYPLTHSRHRGFTLIELLVTIAIIGILASVMIISFSNMYHSALEARAKAETRSFAMTMHTYFATNGHYPENADREAPAGLEPYLTGGIWPDAPWPESVYDWDNWNIDGEQVVQLSVRFCPVGGPLSDCTFPTTHWAENFDVNSAFFYCFEGPCRSHENENHNYPGYCMNCGCREMETCYFSDE